MSQLLPRTTVQIKSTSLLKSSTDKNKGIPPYAKTEDIAEFS